MQAKSISMKHLCTTLKKSFQGKNLKLFTLSNDNNVEVKITNYGATITSIRTPDNEGNFDEIALGFDNPEEYLTDFYINNCPYFGAIAGRYANRIAKGQLNIEGKTYQLATNNLGNALHGGIKGFDKQFWDGNLIAGENYVGVELTYLSPHLEEGYPGNLFVKVIYILNNKNELEIQFNATTDEATALNLTNHTYFNLSGCQSPVTDHYLTINSNRMIEVDNLIPTGQIIDISGTDYDFSQEKLIGLDIDKLPIGYDIGYAIDAEPNKVKSAAYLKDKNSGRTLEILTSEPSIQLYTGYFIPDVKGHKGNKYGKYMGVALETQHYPDSPNHPNFPDTQLQPGDTFSSKTIFRFGTLTKQQ